jgi:hypothetical protein
VSRAGTTAPIIILAVPVLPEILRKTVDTPWILANRIQDGTPGLSTPPEANERIGSIQRIPRLPLPSLEQLSPGCVSQNDELEVARETI